MLFAPRSLFAYIMLQNHPKASMTEAFKYFTPNKKKKKK